MPRWRKKKRCEADLAGQIALAMIDAMAALGVLLCQKGILSRDELAATFTEALRQQQDQGHSELRGVAVAALAQFFARQPFAAADPTARCEPPAPSAAQNKLLALTPLGRA